MRKWDAIAWILAISAIGIAGYLLYSNFAFYSGFCEAQNYTRFSGIELIAIIEGNNSHFVWYAGCCNDDYGEYPTITSSCVHHALPIGAKT
jgi:hypothetical protein